MKSAPSNSDPLVTVVVYRTTQPGVPLNFVVRIVRLGRIVGLVSLDVGFIVRFHVVVLSPVSGDLRLIFP